MIESKHCMESISSVESDNKCSYEKSSSANSFAWILCIVLQLFATVPTLYVSNSFHQYRGAVISKYTVIIRMNFRSSEPPLASFIMRFQSFGPISKCAGIYVSSSSSIPSTNPLSYLFQEFIGLRSPMMIAFHCSGLGVTVFSISIIVPPFRTSPRKYPSSLGRARRERL